jgi:hypothetical protein
MYKRKPRNSAASFCLLLLSYFLNFGSAELTMHSEKLKEIWLFSRFFVPLHSI